jgi:hypothetical protein
MSLFEFSFWLKNDKHDEALLRVVGFCMHLFHCYCINSTKNSNMKYQQRMGIEWCKHQDWLVILNISERLHVVPRLGWFWDRWLNHRAVTGPFLQLGKTMSTADQSKSKPLKITMLFRTVNHLFQWAIYTMAMLNNQRVYTVYIYIWLVVWIDGIFWFSILLGMSSGPIWRSASFFWGVGLNHLADIGLSEN